MERTKSRKTHNWNQIHHVVTAILGYRSLSKYRDAYVYYQRAGSYIIPVKKSNSLSKEYAEKIITLFGILILEIKAIR